MSVVFYAVQSLARLARTVAGKRPARCMILYYHSVPRDQRARFARQLDVIRRHSHVVDVTVAGALASGHRYTGITFDDAFENYLTEALPELAARRMPSTMFVISGALGKSFGPAGRSEKVMTAEQLCSLPQDLVSVGSHTVSHPYLPELALDHARRELRDSRASLEQLLQRDVSTFSFPFGGFSSALVDFCREAGYRRTFTTLPAFAFSAGGDEFVVGRVRVDPTDWPLEFRLKLAGAYNWLPWAFALKRKLKGARSVEQILTKPAAERSVVREWREN
jgi:peptidoglycan/xylan/chitin deacetylase (PgdA/CDA1 family)